MKYDFLKLDYSTGFNGIAILENDDGRFAWCFTSNPQDKTQSEITALFSDLPADSWVNFRPNPQWLILRWLELNTPRMAP